MGLFGIAEIAVNLETAHDAGNGRRENFIHVAVARGRAACRAPIHEGPESAVARRVARRRGDARFVRAYTLEKKGSRTPQQFGKERSRASLRPSREQCSRRKPRLFRC